MPEVTTQVDLEDSLKLSGRTLDFAVAELVMGWVRGTRWGNGNGEWAIDGKGYNEHHKSWDQTPHFSSEIKAAMEVVEKLRGKEWFVEIANTSNKWFVNFIYDINERKDCFAESELLPDAICRASLKAIESQVHK